MRVEELFKLLKREFLKINLMQACLDSISFFLVGNLLLFLFSVDVTSSIDNLPILVGVSVLFFVLDLAFRSQKYNIEIYEEENPELREILRTARDNLEKQDIMSEALFDELMDRSRKVTSDSIVPSRRIVQKIFLVGALSFLTVLSGLTDFQLARDNKDLIEDLGPLENVVDQEQNENKTGVNNATEILGEEKDIQVSEKLVEYNISGSGENSGSDLEAGRENREKAVLDVSGPKLSEDLELAKKYSLAIKELN